MTTHDYSMTMKTVGIAELKARLSEHLRYVRRGHVLTILDRWVEMSGFERRSWRTPPAPCVTPLTDIGGEPNLP